MGVLESHYLMLYYTMPYHIYTIGVPFLDPPRALGQGISYGLGVVIITSSLEDYMSVHNVIAQALLLGLMGKQFELYPESDKILDGVRGSKASG